MIAATHRNLKQRAREALFREDLYYRLSMVEMDVPPLRDRREAIELLAANFVKQFAAEFSRDVR